MRTDREQRVREALAWRTEQLDPGIITRLRAVDYRPRRHRVGKWPAVGGIGTAGVAAGLIAVFSLGSGAATAFAGWTPHPASTLPAGVDAETFACNSHLGTPVLTDVRGPYVAQIFADNAVCLYTTSKTVTSASYYTRGESLPSSTEAAPSEVSFIEAGSEYSATNQLVLGYGHVGAGVTSVSLQLTDGTTVQATVADGWYLAWWPGTATEKSAQINTASGTKTVTAPAASPPPCPGQGCGATWTQMQQPNEPRQPGVPLGPGATTTNRK